MEGNAITSFCPNRIPSNTRGPSEDLDGPGRPWGLCSHQKGPGPLHPCGFLGTCPSSSSSRMFAFLLLLPFPYLVSLWLCTQPWEDWGQVRRSPFHVIHTISRGLERKTARRLRPETPMSWWWKRGMQAVTACDPGQSVKWRLAPAFAGWGRTRALKSDCLACASLFRSLAAWAGCVTALSLRLLLCKRANKLYSLQRVVVRIK